MTGGRATADAGAHYRRIALGKVERQSIDHRIPVPRFRDPSFRHQFEKTTLAPHFQSAKFTIESHRFIGQELVACSPALFNAAPETGIHGNFCALCQINCSIALNIELFAILPFDVGVAADIRSAGQAMRLYMIRRTRGFILQNYAETDEANGRKFITFADGTRSYFPVRQPKSVKFKIDDADPNDPYAKAYSDTVVSAVDGLKLPRYGLANYISADPAHPPTAEEGRIMDGLGRAGVRLMGFCRTNLFKRLESGGPAFIQSIERHVMRNLVYLHALENDLSVPIGTQDAELLDLIDEDADSEAAGTLFENGEFAEGEEEATIASTELDRLKAQAAQIYGIYTHAKAKRFKWLKAALFRRSLQSDLLADVETLRAVLRHCGGWEASRDTKLRALIDLARVDHPNDKILVFTQFADTARYLEAALKSAGVTAAMAVTGQSENPTRLAWRFSPVSNKKQAVAEAEGELRILIATDVLSEGQNLQDCSIIVNFDLPWAIIRLIQRAGRVEGSRIPSGRGLPVARRSTMSRNVLSSSGS